MKYQKQTIMGFAFLLFHTMLASAEEPQIFQYSADKNEFLRLDSKKQKVEIEKLRAVLPVPQLQELVMDYVGKGWHLKQDLKVENSYYISLSPDGQYLAAASRLGFIDIYKQENNEFVRKHQLEFRKQEFDRVSPELEFSRDNSTLLAFARDGYSKIWKLNNGQWKEYSSEPMWLVHASYYRLSSDGSILAAISSRYVRLYGLQNNKYIFLARLPAESIIDFKFSPDGKYLLFVSQKKIWVMKKQGTSYELGKSMESNKSVYRSIRFSLDGTELAVNTDNALLIYKFNDGNFIPIREIQIPEKLTVTSFAGNGTAFSTVLTEKEDKQVKAYQIWSLKNNNKFISQKTAETEIFSSFFSENGNYFILNSDLPIEEQRKMGSHIRSIQIWRNQDKELREDKEIGW